MKRVAVLALALAACHPWYRDGELEGRRADDPAAMKASLDKADALAAAGDPAGAAAVMRAALEQNPMDGWALIRYAEHLEAAGQYTKARAVVQWRIANLQSDDNELMFWDALVKTYTAEDRIADAIDAVNARYTDPSVFVTGTELTYTLSALMAAASTTDAHEALVTLRAFMDSYGCADHPWIDGELELVRATVAAGIPALGHLLDDADAKVQAGDLVHARMLYAEAYRLVPRASFEAHAAGFTAAAAAAGDPAEEAPIAYAHATDGDAAIADHHLGKAIHAYRQAVAEAPWWRAAHENLALLLDEDGRTAAAQAERDFVATYLPR